MEVLTKLMTDHVRFADVISSKAIRTLSHKNILLVDDDPDFTSLISPILRKRFDLHVTVTEDPYDAINLLIDNYFDAVLLDWNLPFLNGKQVLKKAESALALEPDISERWLQERVPVIIVSSSESKSLSSIPNQMFKFSGYIHKKQKFADIVQELRLTFDSLFVGNRMCS